MGEESFLMLLFLFTPQIKWGAFALVSSGNAFIFFTILAYFLVFSSEDEWGF